MGSNPYSRTGAQFANELEKHRAVDAVTDEVAKSLLGDRSYAPIDVGSTDAATITLDGILPYSIGGVMYSAAFSAEAKAFTDTSVQPVITTRAYLVSVNAAGALTITNGLVIPAGQGPTEAMVPPLPANHAPVAAIKVVTNASVPFIPGTTKLDVSGVVSTFYNLATAIRSLP